MRPPWAGRAAADGAAVAAAAAGLLLALPPRGLWPLAWAAPAPLLARALRSSPSRALTLGGAWGVFFFAGTLYWTQAVMVRYGGLSPWLAAGPLALLVVYCAAYFALFLWSLNAGRRRWGPWTAWLAPVLWCALEYLRGQALTGLPWATLAMTQVSFPPALAPAAWLGAYGVGSLIVLAWVWLARVGGGEAAVPRRAALAAGGALLLAIAWLAGAQRARRLDSLPAELRVACLQVNVPQAVKWSPARRREVLEAHRVMTLEAAAAGARLVVWPESSLPFGPGERVPGDAGGLPIEAWVAERARESRVDIVWGGAARSAGEAGGVHNSAFLTRADGTTASRYDKIHLVPFGEYVPLQRVLGFVQPLVRQVGDFRPGRAPVLHRAAVADLGSVICYEILFSGLVRSAAEGADILVNITNDAWFGTSVAPHLHLAAAPLRAAEEGVAVARAANTGISALVLPSGRVLAASRLEERRVLVGGLPALGVRTFYRRHGDVWAGACAIMAAAYLAALASTRPRRAPLRPQASSGPAAAGAG